MLAPHVRGILACPACAAELRDAALGLTCTRCGTSYLPAPSGQPDFRLRAEKRVPVEYQVGTTLTGFADVNWERLGRNPHPAVDFSDLPIPNHLTPELLSYFPRASTPDALMLDLGCGTALHRPACERAGFQYVGLDFANAGAPLLGDAHALPFQAEAFEFVLSMAVLEHIQYPAVMLAEAFRVLRPGGIFLGSVSFLEPFHEVSYQHHSHAGVWSALRQAGFDVQQIAPTWDALSAQTHMALLPGWPRLATEAVTAPLRLLHRVWWRLLRAVRPGWGETQRHQIAAGAFLFLARRPRAANG